MLEYLRIRNLALIEDMELEFSSGMNVLMGETGAGKSFILKALGFLLGDKLSADMVRAGAERAQVEALFSTAEADMVLRREIVAETGRSRLYINDELRSQDSLRDLRNRLVAHTSQHAQQKLLQASFQARLLEGGISCPELLAQREEFVLQCLGEIRLAHHAHVGRDEHPVQEARHQRCMGRGQQTPCGMAVSKGAEGGVVHCRSVCKPSDAY